MARMVQKGRAVVAAAVMTFVAITAAQAGDLWQIESRSGDVRVSQEGVTPASLGGADALPAGTRITTGANGRAILRRGDEAIVIAPNSSLELAADSRPGLATTILQSLGTILLSVDKQNHQHFEVETPYLAAVVKGTKFAVSVADGKASVHVVEGAVEVMDFESGDVGMVRPGQTAQAVPGSGLGLSVTGPSAAAPAKGLRTDRRSRVSPAPASPAASGGTASSAQPAAVRIDRAMGQQAIDVPKATGGLVRAAVVGTGASAAHANAVAGAPSLAAAPGQAVSAAATAASGGLALGLGTGGNSAGGNGGGNAGGNGGGLALGASAGGGNGGGLALGASAAGGNAGGNGGGLALGASAGGGNAGGLALGASVGGGNGGGAGIGLGVGLGNAGGNDGGLALGLGGGNGAANGNAGGNGGGNGAANGNAGGNGKNG